MLGQYENYMSMANPPKIAVQACVCVWTVCVFLRHLSYPARCNTDTHTTLSTACAMLRQYPEMHVSDICPISMHSSLLINNTFFELYYNQYNFGSSVKIDGTSIGTDCNMI